MYTFFSFFLDVHTRTHTRTHMHARTHARTHTQELRSQRSMVFLFLKKGTKPSGRDLVDVGAAAAAEIHSHAGVPDEALVQSDVERRARLNSYGLHSYGLYGLYAGVPDEALVQSDVEGCALPDSQPAIGRSRPPP